MNVRGCSTVLLLSLVAFPAFSDVIYNNDNPNTLIGVSTNPSGNGRIEHETGDDFLLNNPAQITGGTFTGLMPAGATVSDVVIEIYRVFPKDSTSPPSGNVPTRANSPSDIAFDSRDSSLGTLSFTTAVLGGLTVANSVVNGISLATGGEGSVTGQEVQFTFSLATPFNLPADHYFFVPQVELDSGNTFLWLSATRPLSGPFAFAPDLQGWTRDENLDPDWLRVGTDIVGGTTYNFAFSLNDTPEPSTAVLVLCGMGLLVWSSRRKLVG